MTLEQALQSITEPDAQAMKDAQALLDTLIKPRGSLGELEHIAVKIAGITGHVKNKISHSAVLLFGADNGIYDEGVCSSPQDFTRKLMLAYSDNKNAGINILARQTHSELKLYNLGVKGLNEHEGIITHKFMPNGTHNFLHNRAMSTQTALEAIEFGINLVSEVKDNNIDLIATGEVGMANTTTAAACIMAALNSRDTSLIGRGAGLDDESYSRKIQVITKALALHEKNLTDPVNILSCVGGLDIAAITGVFIGGSVFRVPVIIDGVISIAGALLACKLNNECRSYMFASHKSAEPAYNYAAEFLKLEPTLNLSMRLGEGTGAAIFIQIIDDALAIINDMGTLKAVSND